MVKCRNRICNKEGFDDFGGYCPKCEDLMYEA